MRRAAAILTQLLVATLMLSMVSCGSGSLPPNWWELSKARPIHSTQEYSELVTGEAKNKFIFIDFYMEYCPWCYYILDDFNRLVDDMQTWYGPE
jgi:thiol-disulfide isomerase/thioredoxin